MIWFLAISSELILITFPADRDPAADPCPLELNLKPNCIGSVVRLLFNLHMLFNSGRRHHYYNNYCITSKQKSDPAFLTNHQAVGTLLATPYAIWTKLSAAQAWVHPPFFYCIFFAVFSKLYVQEILDQIFCLTRPDPAVISQNFR